MPRSLLPRRAGIHTSLLWGVGAFVLLGFIFALWGRAYAVLCALPLAVLLARLLHQVRDLTQTTERLGAVVNACPAGMLVADEFGNVELLNPEFQRLFGYTLVDLLTLAHWWERACPDPSYRQQVAGLWYQRLTTGHRPGDKAHPMEVRVHCKDGSIKEVLVFAMRLNGDGQNGQMLIAQDVTDQKQKESDLRLAATAFESQEGLVIVATNMRIMRVNRSFTRITGFSAQEATGQTLSIVKSGMQDREFYAEMWQRIQHDGYWHGEILNRRRSGEIYTQLLTITAVRTATGEVTHYIGNMLDISDRKNLERHVHHLAHHDALTDLPNRVLLSDRLNQALAQARRDKAMLGLLYLDLDRFKEVNDELGHVIGDLLLVQVAARLRECVSRTTDTVSRIGGDEFVVLLAHFERDDDAVTVADRILETLCKPFALGSHTVVVETSIGIALYPTHGADALTLMKNADNAMYQAKRQGRRRHCLYQPDLLA